MGALAATGSIGVVLVSALLWWVAPSLDCPPHDRAIGSRALRIQILLASTPDGRQALRRLGHRPRVCFGSVAHGVTQPDGLFVLSLDESRSANAARLSHLLLHQVEGPPLDEARARSTSAPCAVLTAEAIQAERRARIVEARVRRALDPEWETQTTVEADAAELLGLETQYRERCENLRSKAVRPPPGP